MSLNQLPVEIVLLITKSLLEDTKSLASLAPCTKRLHQIVTPVLYSDITVRFKLAPMSVWDGWSSSEDGLSESSANDDHQESIELDSVRDQQASRTQQITSHY